MALGYEGYALLDNTIFLCTGVDLPEQRQKLESQSGYGGLGDATTESEVGIFSPLNYDYPIYDGSVNFDLTVNFWKILKNWIYIRTQSKQLDFYPRSASHHSIDECWWNSISLSGSSGAFVSGSVGILGVTKTTPQRQDLYIANKQGNTQASVYLQSNTLIPGLNRSSFGFTPQENPIPFWNTQISLAGIGTAWKILSWNLNVSQSVERFFKCEGNTTQQPPFVIGVGTMSISLEMEILPINESIVIPSTFATGDLYLGSDGFHMKNLQLQNDAESIRSPGDTVPISLQYDVYEIGSEIF